MASRTVVLFVEPRLCPTSNLAGWHSSSAMLIPACSSSAQALSRFVAKIPRNFTRIHLGSILPSTTEPADPPAAGEPRARVGPLPTVEHPPVRLR